MAPRFHPESAHLLRARHDVASAVCPRASHNMPGPNRHRQRNNHLFFKTQELFFGPYCAPF